MGCSFKGIVFSPDGKQVYASHMKAGISVLDVASDGRLTAAEPIRLLANRARHSESAVPVGLSLPTTPRV